MSQNVENIIYIIFPIQIIISNLNNDITVTQVCPDPDGVRREPAHSQDRRRKQTLQKHGGVHAASVQSKEIPTLHPGAHAARKGVESANRLEARGNSKDRGYRERR